MGGLNPDGLGRARRFSHVEAETTTTERIANDYDFICEDGADLADALNYAAQADTDQVSIRCGRGMHDLSEHLSLPLDVSDTSIILHGQYPGIGKTNQPPDLIMDPGPGTVIDLGGATAFLTGNHIRGSHFKDFMLYNGSGDGFRFGATDEMGCYFTRFQNIFSVDVDDNLLNITNMQHVRGDYLKAYNALRSIRYENDHAGVQGANSYFNEPYVYQRATDAGDKPDGGIKWVCTNSGSGVTTFYRPQVNGFNGTSGTGNGIYITGDAGGAAISFEHCDIEGDHHTAFRADYLTASTISIDTAHNTEYTVYLADTATTPGSIKNQVFVNEPNGGKVFSNSKKNTIAGVVGGIEGRWTGLVVDNSDQQTKIFSGSTDQSVVLNAANNGPVQFNARAVKAKGHSHDYRGTPSTSEIDNGRGMVYVSNGVDGNAIGDLVYAVNDGGTVKTAVIQAVSGTSA